MQGVKIKMNMTFNTPILSGHIPAISSKSEAHRALICAALADSKTEIFCEYTNNDINATVSCLNSLGANIKREDKIFHVSPIKSPVNNATLDAGESGSTLRFLIPIIAALGVNAKIIRRGRLAERPLSPLDALLKESGVTLKNMDNGILEVSGKLKSGSYSIRADVSSQFISGLLFALPLCDGNSTLTLEGKVESENYINMTLDAEKAFLLDIKKENNTFFINGNSQYISKEKIKIAGDWSNAAFFLVAGALSENGISISGLDINSSQGDKEIINVIRSMGADIKIENDKISVKKNKLCGIKLDASQIPDLVPIIATAASVAEGRTVIYNAERLRIKESDRIQSTVELLKSLGASISATDDGMIIDGVKRLHGGNISSFNDHRIAMSAAIASTAADGEITVEMFEAVNKSYPDFKAHFDSIDKSKERVI